MRLTLLVLMMLSQGCQYLFPELGSTDTPDLAGVDAGTAQVITGQVCNLTDVRSYRTCPALAGTYRISVEETRDSVTTDANGSFTLTPTAVLGIVTLGVSDPLDQRVPTVLRVQLAATGTTSVVVPTVSTSQMQLLEQVAGAPGDPTRGMMLAYVVDASGIPVSGVVSARITNATGPLYDGPSQNELDDNRATSSAGTIAFFDLPAGQLTLPLSPPAGYVADSFVLPIRSNAVTISALILRFAQ